MSGLEGEELSVVNDLESGIGSLLGQWLGGGKNLEGDLEKITVTADTDRRLAVRVTYSGFAGKKLWGELQDRSRRPQRELRSEPVILEESGGEVELAFELTGGSQETNFESAYLGLNLAEPNRSVPGLVRTYLLRKKWASSSDGDAGAGNGEVGDEVVIDPTPVRDTPVASPANPEPAPPSSPGTADPGPGADGVRGVRIRPNIYSLSRTLVQPKVDLYDAAGSAQWHTGNSQLPFNGSPADARGFVIAHEKQVLGDGKEHNRVLQTHPEWRDQGWIEGTFSFTLPADANSFATGLGFLQGAGGSDGVTFRVSCKDGSSSVTLLDEHVGSVQVIEKTVAIPDALKGKQVRLTLTVLAGASSGRDWAAWIYPRIY